MNSIELKGPAKASAGDTISFTVCTSGNVWGAFDLQMLVENEYGRFEWATVKWFSFRYGDFTMPSGYESVQFRVSGTQEFDSGGTGTILSEPIVVQNTNTAPTMPGSVTIPGTIRGGTAITVSWTAAIDAEGLLMGYEVEKSTNGGSTWTQIYKGTALSSSDNVASGTASVMYRARAYDSEGLKSGWRTSALVAVINNTAPTMPAVITVPETVRGGTAITISWTASSDEQNDLEGYTLEKSTDGGTSWTQIYQGSATNTTNTVAFGTESVMYRVRAYDSQGLTSGYRSSIQIAVINNTAPTAPGSITVPESVFGGGTVEISWTASADSEGNLAGYALERRVDEGAWTEIFRGDALSFTDTVTKGWTSAAWRVRAYDSENAYSGYAVSEVRAVENNAPPAITCASPSGSSLGVKDEGFSVDYSVSDEDGDAVTVTESVDGVTLRSFTAEDGETNHLQVDGVEFMKLLNGGHTLDVTASDNKTAAVHRLTFVKSVTSARISLEQPMTADAPISVCVLSVTGSIPADALFSVEVTNNGLDDQPVWEDCTGAVKSGSNYIFQNETAENGPAFNFRVTAERGDSGQGGYITSVQGGFQ